MVGGADRAGVDLDQDVVVTDGRHGDVLDVNDLGPAEPVVDRGFHRVTVTAGASVVAAGAYELRIGTGLKPLTIR